MKQYATLEDSVYFWFGSNDTSGSGNDGASPAADVRLAGAASDAAPVDSPTPVLLSHANYPAGCYEVEVEATAANGFAAGNTYAVFCTLAVDSQNPTGFIGSFDLKPVEANLLQIGDGAQSATDLKDFADTGYDPSTHKVQGVVLTDTCTALTGHTAQTGDNYARLGAPAGASVSADIAAVKAETADIVADTNELQTDDIPGTLSTMDGKIDTIDGIVDDILVDTAEIGAAGVGLTEAGGDGDHLTAINLPNQTMDITGDITGNLSGSVGSVTGDVSVDEIKASALADLFNTDSGTDYDNSVAGSVVKEIADNAGGSALTAEGIADAVWDEASTGHTDAGKAGAQLWTDIDAILNDTDELQTNQGDWATATGFMLDTEDGSSFDSIPDMATATNQGTMDGKLDTIQERTDNLPDDPADDSDIDGQLSTIDTIADELRIALVNKMIITEATGNTEFFNESSVSQGSIAACYATDGTYTTRKRLAP